MSRRSRTAQARLGRIIPASIVAVALLTAADAGAATGDLTFSSCVGNGLPGCTPAAGGPLDDASAVAVRPDGNSLYVVSPEADSISHLTVAPDGQITFAGCVSNEGSGGCVNAPGTPLDFPTSVAVRPDGNSLYVTSAGSDSVSHFTIATGGQITFAGCVSNTGAGGCTDAPGTPIDNPQGIAIRPDGNSLYVNSQGPSSVSHFTIATGGQITFAGCVSNTGAGGCTDAPGTSLATPSSVAIRPDGNSLYVASLNSDSLSHMTIAPGGQITFAGCVSDDGSGPCTDVPGPLKSPISVAVRPDGNSLYALSLRPSVTATQFTVAAGGQITSAACLNNDGTDGCADPPGRPFFGAQTFALSPAGDSLYVTDDLSDRVTHLTISPDGHLSFANCLSSSDAAANASCQFVPEAPLTGAIGIAVGPDGGSLYVASLRDDSVTHFVRETPGMPPPDPATDTDPPGLMLRAKKVEAGRPIKVTVSCDEACDISLSGSGKPKGEKQRKLVTVNTELVAGEQEILKLKPTRKLKRKLRRVGKGRALVKATATDVAGNTSDARKRVKLK